MDKELWRLARTGPLPGALNMALDEALLNAVGAGRSRPVLRLYRWRPAAVSLGYFQRGAQVVNRDACRAMGVDVVRRMTGGRAVLHDRELTYAVMADARGGLFSARVLDNYRRIAEVLRRTLRSFGLEVVMAPGRRSVGDGGAARSACFTAPSSFELVCHGCKIAGSAQKRQGEVFLQHGSIPVDLDPVKLFRVLDTAGAVAPAEGGRRLAESVGWVNRWLARPVTVDEVEDRLVACFAELLNVELVEEPPTAEEWRESERLVAERYGDRDWTWRDGVRAEGAC
jgi:lipoate-protein ligase A